MKRILRITAGFALLLVGAICGLIPVVQGWVFGLAGLAMLSADFAWARLLRIKIRKRFRHLAQRLRRRP